MGKYIALLVSFLAGMLLMLEPTISMAGTPHQTWQTNLHFYGEESSVFLDVLHEDDNVITFLKVRRPPVLEFHKHDKMDLDWNAWRHHDYGWEASEHLSGRTRDAIWSSFCNGNISGFHTSR